MQRYATIHPIHEKGVAIIFLAKLKLHSKSVVSSNLNWWLYSLEHVQDTHIFGLLYNCCGTQTETRLDFTIRPIGSSDRGLRLFGTLLMVS